MTSSRLAAWFALTIVSCFGKQRTSSAFIQVEALPGKWNGREKQRTEGCQYETDAHSTLIIYTCYKTFPVIGVSMAKVNDYSEHLQVSTRSGHSAGHLIFMDPCSISDILPKLEPLFD